MNVFRLLSATFRLGSRLALGFRRHLLVAFAARAIAPVRSPKPRRSPRRNIFQIRSLSDCAPLGGLLLGCLALGCLTLGCAGHRYGHLLAHDDKDMAGSHAAGSATWNPLVDEAVARLLAHCPPAVEPVSFETAAGIPMDAETIGSALSAGPSTICFIGVENASAEEMLDFKDQIYERIDSQINSADTFRSVSRRMIDAALLETRLRPDSLFLPANRSIFTAVLGQQGAPVDYLLFAKITSGTTDRNTNQQRDYMLTLELVNVRSGDYLKESATIRKGYSKTRVGKWWNYGPFDQADG